MIYLLAATALAGVVTALVLVVQRDRARAGEAKATSDLADVQAVAAKQLDDAKRATAAAMQLLADAREQLARLDDECGRLAADKARLSKELDDATRHDPVRAGAVLDDALGEKVSGK